MNLFYIGSALNLSALYMTAGTGSAFSIKSGNLNFGGEGQIYLGGLIAAIVLAKCSNLPAPVGVFLAFLCAFCSAGLMALISGVLKKTKNADFLFTSYLCSAGFIPLIDALINGPFRSKSDNLLATSFIAEKFRFTSIMPPSVLNATFFIAVFLCAAFYFLINKTPFGSRLTIYGISPKFSEFSGYNNTQFVFTSAFVSGAMHGLCGAFAITGTYFTCHNGFYFGMGWAAFSAALLSGANPFFMIPSSLFLGFITTYSNRFALYNNMNFDISSMIQSLVMLLLSFSLYRQKR